MDVVTVIVPTYNRAHLVTNALDSVLAQTYRPIECIVVDDGSTDETVEVVKEWKRAHNSDDFSVRLLQQENKGAPAARNRGMGEASGTYLLFLDSDDRLKPLAVEELHESLVATDADVAYGDLVRIDERGRTKRRCQRPSSSSDVVNMIRRAPITSSAMIRREALKEVRWRAKLSCAQEFALFLDLALNGGRFTYEPTVVLKKTENSSQDSISGRDDTDYPLTISRILVDVGPQVRALGEQENDIYDQALVHRAGLLASYGQHDFARKLMHKANRLRTVRTLFREANLRADILVPACLGVRLTGMAYRFWRLLGSR